MLLIVKIVNELASVLCKPYGTSSVTYDVVGHGALFASLLQVFYVDYGNAEWLPKCDVRTPKPEFLHLPFQAIECHLYGVTPIKGKEEIAR